MLRLVTYKLKFMRVNGGDPDQTPLIAVSALGLHFWPTSEIWTQGSYWLGINIISARDPDSTLLTATSALGLHCLPTSKIGL